MTILLALLLRFLLIVSLVALAGAALTSVAHAQDGPGATIGPWVAALGEPLMNLVITLVGAVVLVLGRKLDRWLAARYDLDSVLAQRERDALLTSIVDRGVAATEHRSRRFLLEHQTLPEGPQKLKWATDWIVDEARRLGLPPPTRGEIAELVNAALGDDRRPGVARRADQVASERFWRDTPPVGGVAEVPGTPEPEIEP